MRVRSAHRHLRRCGRRLAVTLLVVGACGAALAAGTVIEAEGYVHEQPQGEPVNGPAPAPAVSAADSRAGGDATASGGGAAASGGTGPGVEMITGGNSKDGTAHVGRLPVLE